MHIVRSIYSFLHCFQWCARNRNTTNNSFITHKNRFIHSFLYECWSWCWCCWRWLALVGSLFSWRLDEVELRGPTNADGGSTLHIFRLVFWCCVLTICTQILWMNLVNNLICCTTTVTLLQIYGEEVERRKRSRERERAADQGTSASVLFFRYFLFAVEECRCFWFLTTAPRTTHNANNYYNDKQHNKYCTPFFSSYFSLSLSLHWKILTQTYSQINSRLEHIPSPLASYPFNTAKSQFGWSRFKLLIAND